MKKNEEIKEELKEEEKKKITIKEIITNKRYRAIANLIFYPLIIIILIAYARTGSNRVNVNTTKTDSFLTNIVEKNFEFKYTVTVDEEKTEFDGKQYLNKILFTNINTNKKYYAKDDMFLEEENGKYVLSENPKKYFNYLDVDLINNIFSKAKKDENDYVIMLSDFLPLIGYADSEVLEDFEILIETESSDKDALIVFDLDEYSRKFLNEEKKLKIELNYYNFGQVEDFDIQ